MSEPTATHGSSERGSAPATAAFPDTEMWDEMWNEQMGCRHRRHPKPVRCTCGYNACCDIDLDEHVVALMHDDESHFEARQ